MKAVKAIAPFAVDCPAFAPEKDADAPVAVAYARLGDLPDPLL